MLCDVRFVRIAHRRGRPILPTPCEVNAVLTKYVNNQKGWAALNYAIEQNDFQAAVILIEYIKNFKDADDS